MTSRRGAKLRVKKTSRTTWNRLIFLFLLIGLGIGGYFLGQRMFLTGLWGSSSRPQGVEESLASGEKREVILFFAAPTGEGLVTEPRSILRSVLLEEIKTTVQALITGSEQGNLPVVPAQAQVREVYLDKEGTAYIDFSREIQSAPQGGGWWELLTVYSIVNSLTQNFPEVRQVQILVEGQAVETLTGHVRTDRPFTERLSF